MSNNVEGGCLCGGVRFVVTGPFRVFHWCHCSRCRKDTGTAHASNIFTTPDRIRWISGKDRTKRFDLPDATRYAKAFCTECGSPVPYLSRDGKTLTIPAGSLDGDPGIEPLDNLHWRSRAPWYDAGLSSKKWDDEPPE